MSRPPAVRASLGLFAALLFAAFAGRAGAVSLSFDDCDAFGCQGASISLDVMENADGSFDVDLGIDTTDYTGDRTLLTSASFKAIKGVEEGDLSLVSTPGGDWSEALEANINNADCSGSGNDFACTEGSVEIGASTEPGTWRFHVAQGTLLPTSDWHIGFKYGEGNGQIISASAPIPEPSAALAFGLGALLVGGVLRRAR